MNRFAWISTVYGYVVCVICVVTFLVNASGLVDAAFDRANPFGGRNAFGPFGTSLTSFESFRLTHERDRPTRVAPSAPNPGDTLTTAELRARYETLRADHVTQATYQATQRLVKHTLLIVVALVLFAGHWRWLRRERALGETI
jgi:hypothetical protein